MPSIEVLGNGTVVADLPSCTITANSITELLNQLQQVSLGVLLQTATLDTTIVCTDTPSTYKISVMLNTSLPTLRSIILTRCSGQTIPLLAKFPTQEDAEFLATFPEAPTGSPFLFTETRTGELPMSVTVANKESIFAELACTAVVVEAPVQAVTPSV